MHVGALAIFVAFIVVPAKCVDQTIDWTFGTDDGGGKFDILQCQAVTFDWMAGGFHDVWDLSDGASFISCDFSNATELAPSSETGSFTIRDNDTLNVTKRWFGCRVGNHCDGGNMKVAVKIRPHLTQKFPGASCDGGKIDVVKNEATLKACRKRCKRRRGCIAIEYVSSTQKCKAFSEVPTEGIKNADSTCEIARTTCGEEPLEPSPDPVLNEESCDVEDGPRLFTSALAPILYEDEKSSAFSPASFRQAWFMLGAGAGRDNDVEIRKALSACYDGPFEDLGPRIMDLEEQSDSLGLTNLTVANALFIDSEFPVKQSYQEAVERVWRAEAFSVDFDGAPEEAKELMNSYVSEKTQGVIPEVIESVPPLMVMYLINTLYFAAKWEDPFEEEALPSLFYDNARGVMAQTMRKEDVLPYYEDKLVTAVSIPYEDTRYEMLLIRPRDCLNELVKHSGFDTMLRRAIAGTDYFSRRHVTVKMPTFHVTWRGGTSVLIPALQNRGMHKVFDDTTADLTGISDEEGIYVKDLIHVADVRVNEAGTIAAAATAIGVGIRVGGPSLDFTLEKPFIYVILHRPTQSILFSGWVTIDALEVEGEVNFDAPPEECY